MSDVKYAKGPAMRMKIWFETKAEMDDFIRASDWNRPQYEACANGNGFWLRQPGRSTLFPGGEKRVFIDRDMKRIERVTVGTSTDKHIIKVSRAKLITNQY